jgi:hypothetical protein
VLKSVFDILQHQQADDVGVGAIPTNSLHVLMLMTASQDEKSSWKFCAAQQLKQKPSTSNQYGIDVRATFLTCIRQDVRNSIQGYKYGCFCGVQAQLPLVLSPPAA